METQYETPKTREQTFHEAVEMMQKLTDETVESLKEINKEEYAVYSQMLIALEQERMKKLEQMIQ